MGRAIIEHLRGEQTFDVVGVVDKLAGAAAVDGLPVYTDAAAACDACRPDVVIDFTNAAWTPELTAACLPRGVRPVIGTTGLGDAYVQTLADQCRERALGGVLAANFAIGAVLMMHAARLAAPFFESAEIIELHHDQKADAPSGTSLATARGMLEARDGRRFIRNTPDAEPLPGARAAHLDGITIHSVRLPGLVAHQEVLFGAAGQTLSIRHDTTGRESFMPGIVLAAHEVMERSELVIGLDRLIGLRT